jgi:tetratricopeptide (TPR) repeat protein
MALWGLSAARNNYELRMLDNVIEGRRANERLARAFESQAAPRATDLSPVIASQDRLNSGVNALSNLMGQVDETLGAILTTVDQGFADMAYQQRLANSSLHKILEVLQAPLDTRAKELRRRAEEAYGNGWIEDATRDFTESEELNRYDFTVHHALGTIAFFHGSDLGEADRQFKLAAQYSRPKSAVDCTYALLAQSSVAEKLGNTDEALKLAREAVEVADGAVAEAYYARGRFTLATGGDAKAAVSDLETSFWGNPALVVTTASDELLQAHPRALSDALELFRSGLQSKTAEYVAATERILSQIEPHTFYEVGQVFNPVVKKVRGELLPTVAKLQKRDSIADYLEAIRLVGKAEVEVRESARSAGRSASTALRGMANDYDRKDSRRLGDAQATTSWMQSPYGKLIGLGAVIGAIVMPIWEAAHSQSFGTGLLNIIVGPFIFGFWGIVIGALAAFVIQILGAIYVRTQNRIHPEIARLQAAASEVDAVVADI